MEKEMLRSLAARMVTDGLRRAEVMSGEAWRQRRLADLMPDPERLATKLAADEMLQRAARIRQIAGRLAAAHDIGPKRTGRRLAPRPAQQKSSTAVLKGKVAYAR
jgi:hypothetical protein